jgi:hypothetical protein
MVINQGEEPPAAEEPEKPVRRYDKGERRFKHVGRKAYAEIEFVQGNPSMAIGKCPNTLTPNDCEAMLEDAIAGPNGDRDIDFPKKLYMVHDGVIYEAQTTTGGQSYHGYPFRGRLSRKLLKELERIAGEKNCETEFNAWVKRHIQ